jgi:hypothetical protein
MGWSVAFEDALVERLAGLTPREQGSDRHDSWMTAAQIVEWGRKIGELDPSTRAAEVDQVLLRRAREDPGLPIRYAKYPHATNMFRLWGHERVVGDYGELPAVEREDEAQRLPDLGLPEGCPSVFLSHSAGDFELALRLRAALGELGLDAWMYQAGIGHGELVFETVRAAMARCDSFVALLTRSSTPSAWVYTEVQTAILTMGIPVFCVLDGSDEDLMTLVARAGPGDRELAWLDEPSIRTLREDFARRHPEAAHRAETFATSARNLLGVLPDFTGICVFQPARSWELRIHTIPLEGIRARLATG